MLILALMLAAASPNPSGIEGRWLTPGGKAVVEVAPCGPALCGTIVATKQTEAGASPRDLHNQDPTLRSRPLVGVRLLTGFVRDGEVWRGGRIYNPEDGKTYTSSLTLRPGGTLAVKGCVMFICRTQEWKRVN